MRLGLFRRHRTDGTIAALYGTIVAQARLPAFYRRYRVPDTVDGRLEMVLLHTSLFYRRTRAAAAAVGLLGQDVFDLFCSDMDGTLREMGVGDLAVPRQMRRIGEAFYGRATAYEAALSASDERALTEALLRNVFSGVPRHLDSARRLGAYIIKADAELACQEDAALADGQIRFPNPEAF